MSVLTPDPVVCGFLGYTYNSSNLWYEKFVGVNEDATERKNNILFENQLTFFTTFPEGISLAAHENFIQWKFHVSASIFFNNPWNWKKL